MLHIKQLIIVGGPSCAGKSFLIKKIQQGEYPLLRGQLGISNPSSWRYVAAKDINHIGQSIVERLVVHYDLYAQRSKIYEFNHIHQLINYSENTVILTLNVPRLILTQRVSLRLSNTFCKYLTSLTSVKQGHRSNYLRFKIYRLWKKLKAYIHGECDQLYNNWFDFISQFNISGHWILRYSKSSIFSAYPYETNKSCLNKVESETDTQSSNKE